MSSMLSLLQHLFTRTITIEPWAGQNTFGEASYGAAVSYLARIEPTTIRTSGENQVVMSGVKVILNTYVQVDPRDRVKIPSAYGSRNDAGAFEIPKTTLEQVKYLDDEDGPMCTVLICTGAN